MSDAWQSRFGFLFELHEYTILEILSLQKGLSIDWAVKESLEAQIPQQIFSILLSKKVLIEIRRKIDHNSLEISQRILSFSIELLFIQFGHATMEKAKVPVECGDYSFEQRGIVFVERRRGSNRILCYSLTFCFRVWSLAINGVRVSHYQV